MDDAQKQAFYARILDKFNLQDNDINSHMSTINDLEPHATYKALMNLFDSEPDPYLKKSSNMRNSNSPETGSASTKLGKLEQVKDALKFII